MYIGDGSYDDVLETQQGDSCRIEGMVFLVAVLEDGNGDWIVDWAALEAIAEAETGGFGAGGAKWSFSMAPHLQG